MKPVFTHIGHSPQQQLLIVERDLPYFDTPFHFHPECELVYITEGYGKRIVGDSVEAYQPGDLVFLGSNVAHVWYSDEAHYKGTDLRSRAIVVYFHKDIFGKSFYSLQETQSLRQLFHRAERGLKISGSVRDRISPLLTQLPSAGGMDRIIGLLEVLKLLAHSDDYELLASIGYQNSYHSRDNHKIDEVFQYVSQNFCQNITLEDMARRCHMARHSFCRFFKKRTQRTFIDFLNEFRASHAKKLLIEEEEMTIREIAYQCGFNNLSNFNKIFKTITGTTPKGYREHCARGNSTTQLKS